MIGDVVQIRLEAQVRILRKQAEGPTQTNVDVIVARPKPVERSGARGVAKGVGIGRVSFRQGCDGNEGGCVEIASRTVAVAPWPHLPLILPGPLKPGAMVWVAG